MTESAYEEGWFRGGLAMAVLFTMTLQTSMAASEGDPEGLKVPTETNAPVSASLEAIKNGLTARYESIRAMKVEYSQSVKNGLSSGEPIPNCWINYRWKAEKRYRAVTDNPGSGEVIRVADDESTSVHRSNVNRLSVEQGRQSILDCDPYVQSLGIPLSDSERASVGVSDFLLPTALSAAKMEWTLKPTLDLLDGVECHVIESNTGQRIWVDTAEGFLMRFRELRFRVSGTEWKEWPIAFRYHFENPIVVDGISVPTKVTVDTYVAPASPKNLWNTLDRSAQFLVSNVSLNESVGDNDFTIDLQPGCEVRDHFRKKYYRLGADGQQLELLAEMTLGDLKNRRSRLPFLVVSAILLIVVSLFCIFKNRLGNNQQYSVRTGDSGLFWSNCQTLTRRQKIFCC